MNIFYVAFYQGFMTERGKAFCKKFGGEFDKFYNWFEFPSLNEAREFVLCFNRDRKYGQVDIVNEHTTEFLTYQASVVYDGQPFDGKEAGELFTLAG